MDNLNKNLTQGVQIFLKDKNGTLVNAVWEAWSYEVGLNFLPVISQMLYIDLQLLLPTFPAFYSDSLWISLASNKTPQI